MKPRVPLEHFASPCGESKMLRNSYASELVEYLNYFYKYVDEKCITAREARDHAYLREHCVSEHLREGEYYLLQKPPEKNLSIRFEQKLPDEIFQVAIAHGEGSAAKTYTLCNSLGLRDNLNLFS